MFQEALSRQLCALPFHAYLLTVITEKICVLCLCVSAGVMSHIDFLRNNVVAAELIAYFHKPSKGTRTTFII